MSYTLDGIPSDLLDNNNKEGIRRIKISDYETEVARGHVSGATQFGAHGYLETSGAVVNHKIWNDGVFAIPNQSGIQPSIVSTSAEDTLTGTGVRVVHVHYLDINLDEQIETVEMNGTTPVQMTATDVRFIQCMHCVSHGTTNYAVGDITAYVGSQIYSIISANGVRCTSSLRMVPRGKRLLVKTAMASSASGANKSISTVSIVSTFFLEVNHTDNGGTFFPYGSLGFSDGTFGIQINPPMVFTEGAVVGMTVTTTDSSTITGDWFGILEDAN